jgi:transposase
MSGVILSPADRAYLLRRMRQQTNSAVHRRMNVLLLLDDGWTAERIAEALYIDAETVREHRRRYEKDGVGGIERLSYQGGESDLTHAQQAELKAELDRRIYLSAKQVCGFVLDRFGISYTANAMSKLMGRLGYVYKKPMKVPAKADAEAQQRFVQETLAPLMASACPETPLYFADGMHPAYTAHPAYGWIRKGEARELPSNHGRTNININGALRWPDRTLVWQPAEKITSAAMIKLFDRLQADHPTSTAIRVIIDNARYNHSTEIRDYLARPGCRIELIYLPSYAPNLNLIERLWRFVKKQALWNRYYPTFAEFRTAVIGLLDNIAGYHSEIASLITDKFNFIGVANTQIL